MPDEPLEQTAARVAEAGAALSTSPADTPQTEGQEKAAERPLRNAPPRPRPKKKGKKTGGTTGALRGAAAASAKEGQKKRSRELEAELARVLTFPAVPSIMLAPTNEAKAFLGNHFTAAGPSTAAQLVSASENSPELREILERMTKGSVAVTVGLALIGYAAPPVLFLLGLEGPAAAVSIATSADDEALAALRSMIPADEPSAAPTEHEGPAGASAQSAPAQG
jgi:hypothetical protein